MADVVKAKSSRCASFPIYAFYAVAVVSTTIVFLQIAGFSIATFYTIDHDNSTTPSGNCTVPENSNYNYYRSLSNVPIRYNTPPTAPFLIYPGGPKHCDATNVGRRENVSQPTCKDSLAYINFYLDNYYDPCENFYEFACNTWNNLNPPPYPALYMTTLSSVSVDNLLFLAELLENNSTSKLLSSSAQKKAADFYSSCRIWLRVRCVDVNIMYTGTSYSEDYYTECIKSPVPNKVVQGQMQYCANRTNIEFPHVTFRLFVENAYTGDKRDAVEHLISTVKQEYISLVPSFPWIKPNAKDKIISRMKNLKVLFQLPPHYLNTTVVDKLYEKFEVTSSDYYQNLEKINSMFPATTDYWEWLGGDGLTESEYFYLTRGLESNAWYDRLQDTISIPPGIVQEPAFSTNRTTALNYGALATIIAHEMTHALETYAGEYVFSGVNKMMHCVNWQYDNFTDGQLDLVYNIGASFASHSENMADSMGLYVAFKALDDTFGNGTSNAKPFNGTKSYTAKNMTPKQSFFVGFAQAWCRSYPKENSKQYYDRVGFQRDSNKHSPNSDRVKGALMNNEHFADAFNCPLGSVYNPGKDHPTCRQMFG